MPKHLPSLAIWTLIVGSSFAFGKSPSPAPAVPLTRAATPVRDTLTLMPEIQIDQQMRLLERHARINMILYSGRFGEPEPVDRDFISLRAGIQP